jgi:leader peptidase (prepilin peptidase)/N-methyltransferase
MDVTLVVGNAFGGLLAAELVEPVVRRWPRAGLPEAPRGRCATCGRRLGVVASSALVGAPLGARRCPSCGKRPAVPWPWLAPVLGLVAAAVLAGFAWRIGPNPELAAYDVAGLALVTLAAIDLRVQLVPVRVLYPVLVAVAAGLVAASLVESRVSAIGHAAAVGLACFGVFLVVHLVVPEGMGFGDVRLAGLVGAVTGWLGPGWHGAADAFVALLAAFASGALVGVGLVALRGYGRKSRVPFAPFLSLGGVVGVVFGPQAAHVLLHV